MEKNSMKNPHPKLEGSDLILLRKKEKPQIKSIKGIKNLPIPKEEDKKLLIDMFTKPAFEKPYTLINRSTEIVIIKIP